MCKKKFKTKSLMAGVAVSFILSGLTAYASEDEAPANNYEVVEEMGLGFNLGKTFAATVSGRQNMDDIKKRIDKAYYEGFNTLRIPVQFTKLIDGNGNIVDDSTMNLIQQTVDYAYDKGMYVVLGSMFDLGDNKDSYWDLSDVKSTEFVTQYTNMWTDIAEAFPESEYNYRLIFEGYNEVKNYYGSVTTAPDGSAYTFGYKDAASQAPDAYYFAGRCGNIDYMQSLNKTWAGIMEDVAPNRYYFISSYAGSARSAYTDYSSYMWGSGGKLSTYDYNLNGGWGTCWLHYPGINKNKAIYSYHDYELSNIVKNYDTLKKFFDNKKINLPIYVGEYGTHTANFEKHYNNLVNVVKGLDERNSGGCLWDDTQSMSFLEYGKWEWFNSGLMSDLITAANQLPRIEEDLPEETLPEHINITVTLIGDDSVTMEVPYGITTDELIEVFKNNNMLKYVMETPFEWTNGVYGYEEKSLCGYCKATWTLKENHNYIEDEEIFIEVVAKVSSEKIYTVNLYDVEQADKTSSTKPYAEFYVPKNTKAADVIKYIYETYELPEKEGYEFVGFYQEGTRPYFLYEDSGRSVNGGLNLYAKYRKIEEVETEEKNESIEEVKTEEETESIEEVETEEETELSEEVKAEETELEDEGVAEEIESTEEIKTEEAESTEE